MNYKDMRFKSKIENVWQTFSNSAHAEADPGIFDLRGGGGANFCFKRTVELVEGKLILPHTQNPFPPVVVVRYNSLAPYRVPRTVAP